MKKKTAIVTGSSSGFGLLCVTELAKVGFEVIATMRDLNKADLLLQQCKRQNVSESIHIHALDVTSKESIENFKKWLEQWPSIDVLVNNAGIALGGMIEELPLEDYRLQFETNFFGVIGVTQAVLPFMRKQGSGRIINMSSISGQMGFPGLSPYVASKHALEGFSEVYHWKSNHLALTSSLWSRGHMRPTSGMLWMPLKFNMILPSIPICLLF